MGGRRQAPQGQAIETGPEAMTDSLTLFLHIVAGAAGLGTGAVALAVRKGQGLHRAAGAAYVWSMLAMAGLGTAIAIGMSEPIAIIPGLITLYLVTTGWAAVRPAPGVDGVLERRSALVGVAIAVLGLALAAQAGHQGTSTFLLAASAIPAFAAWQDYRVSRRGGLTGPERLARHLWRLCTSLAIAASSFFLGQQDEFPKVLQGSHNAIPPIAVLVVMVFWLVRVRRPRRGVQPA
jgi:hypothetical protein